MPVPDETFIDLQRLAKDQGPITGTLIHSAVLSRAVTAPRYVLMIADVQLNCRAARSSMR
jgi:hypothetical protein